MNDLDYFATRERHAEAIARSAARLEQMCKSNMPDIMIETERQLLAHKLILFPVVREAQIACEITANKERERETDYLAKTDFFADSEPTKDSSGL